MIRNLTIDDVLFGHNCPDAGWYKNIYRENFLHLTRLMGYTREEAIEACNGNLMFYINFMNRYMNNPEHEIFVENPTMIPEFTLLREWLTSNPEPTVPKKKFV